MFAKKIAVLSNTYVMHCFTTHKNIRMMLKQQIDASYGR